MKITEILILLSLNKVLSKCSQTHWLTHFLWLLSRYNGINYLSSGHLQKKFAKPCLKIFGLNSLIESLVDKNWTKVDRLVTKQMKLCVIYQDAWVKGCWIMPEVFLHLYIFFHFLKMVNYIDWFQNETTLLLPPRINLVDHEMSSIFLNIAIIFLLMFY